MSKVNKAEDEERPGHIEKESKIERGGVKTKKRQINRGHERKAGKKDRLREIGKSEKSQLSGQRERDPVETERS
jgi:hypothetical protein